MYTFRRRGVILLLLVLFILLVWLHISYNLDTQPATTDGLVKPFVEQVKVWDPPGHPLLLSKHKHSTRHHCTHDCHAYTKRLSRYCHNSLLNGTEYPSSDEGALLNGRDQYELVHLHIIARHGDRTPVSKLRLGPAIYYECGLSDGKFDWNGLDDFPPPVFFFSSRTFNRHFQLNPGVERKECGDSKGVGVLTARGYKQHGTLGKMMQERYQDFVSNIINNVDSLNSDMFVQSTDVSRTVCSLSAFLLGFLPDSPQLRQSMAIHISKGTLLVSPPTGIETVYHQCHDYFQLWQDDQRQTGYTAKENTKRFLISKLCSMFGVLNKCHTMSLPKIFEQIVIRGCHQSSDSLPCADSNKCVSYSQALELFKLIDWVWSKKHPLKSSIVAMAPFLNHSVLTPMERVISDHQEVTVRRSSPGSFRLMVSLTHDDTITKLLTSLGIQVTEWMPYASRLVFELWKKRGQSAPEDFMVRLLFNGELVTKQCGAMREGVSDELIPFPVFRNFLTTGPYRDIDSYNRVCGLS